MPGRRVLREDVARGILSDIDPVPPVRRNGILRDRIGVPLHSDPVPAVLGRHIVIQGIAIARDKESNLTVALGYVVREGIVIATFTGQESSLPIVPRDVLGERVPITVSCKPTFTIVVCATEGDHIPIATLPSYQAIGSIVPERHPFDPVTASSLYGHASQAMGHRAALARAARAGSRSVRGRGGVGSTGGNGLAMGGRGAHPRHHVAIRTVVMFRWRL
jgi:hypothetical protein